MILFLLLLFAIITIFAYCIIRGNYVGDANRDCIKKPIRFDSTYAIVSYPSREIVFNSDDLDMAVSEMRSIARSCDNDYSLSNYTLFKRISDTQNQAIFYLGND